MFGSVLNFVETLIVRVVVFITNYLPVKVIKDDDGRPFLYRYHILSLWRDGPGLVVHHFVKSDPDRGHHSHPWLRGLSFILSGGYSEQILNDDKKTFVTYNRNRWTFNYIRGKGVYHRVMLDEGKTAWTLFVFGSRTKRWGMIGLDGKYKAMSTQIHDLDWNWYKAAMVGLGIHSHLEHQGKVIASVDIIVYNKSERKILLIKRGKDPFKGKFALPGGRIEQKDQDIMAAAKRELYEETNIKDVELEYFRTIGNNTRDPRGFCITNVFICYLGDESQHKIRAGDDAIDYIWADIKNLPELAFDHNEIIQSVYED